MIPEDESAKRYRWEGTALISGDARYYLCRGDVLMTEGKFLEAEASYHVSLELQPNSPTALCSLGKLFKKQGRRREAEACYRRAIELQPSSAVAYYFLGNSLYDERPTEAETCYRRAIELQPDFSWAHCNLGSLLGKEHRYSEEQACYRRVIELNPNLAEAHSNLGRTLTRQGKFSEAETCHRRALELRPDLAEVHYNLGEVLGEQGQLSEAERCFRRAIELKADLAEAHGRLGEMLMRLGAISEAEASYRRAIMHKPDFAAAIYSLANLLYSDGRLLEAAVCYERVIELNPDSAFAYINLGNILGGQGQIREEEMCYQRAIELKPSLAAAHSNLGNALKKQRKFAEARACYERAIENRPDFAEAYCNLGTLQQERGQLVQAETCYRRALAIIPDFAVAHSNLLFCLSHSAQINAQELFAEHRRFGKHFEKQLRHSWVEHANSRDPHRCLKVGFVSGDLRSHPVAILIEPILSHLVSDPKLSLHAFVTQVIEDETSDRLRGYFHHWHRIAHLSDAALAERIRNENIDILIDLSGHTANNRLLTFARKPAPVQASWVGYMGTTGMLCMDYYLADRFLLPRAQFEGQLTEKIIYLPAVASYLPGKNTPPISTLPALRNGYFSFGSFNRVSKLNRDVINLWARLLRALPLARMVIGNISAASAADMVIDWFAREGISSNRLSLHQTCDRNSYLGLYHGVDICLDSFPFTGFTTTIDAMWMGVPTLTRAGCTPPGRQSAAALSHVGLEEFIAADEIDFVEKGLRVTADPDALCRLRSTFRERVERSSLGQSEYIATRFKDVLRTVWIDWCARLSSKST